MDERVSRLIDALKEERAKFLLSGRDIEEYDVAIKYLETGTTNKDPDEFDLLYAVINDYDTTCCDYGIF